MTLIVDASVVLKWFLEDEPHAAEARAILNAGEAVIAPDIVVAEVCNAAWLGVRAGRIRDAQAQDIGRALPNLFDVLISGSGLAERGIAIAIQLDHPAYDCFYLALAEVRGAPLVTADRRLIRKIRRTPWETRVLLLENYA